eukprot:jgi/Galph1/3565/GphlegSOOS_G2233.1
MFQLAKEIFRSNEKTDVTSVPDNSSPRSKEAQQKLMELTKYGLIHVGDKAKFHYKSKEFEAEITADGCLLYRGENSDPELFLSPSAFVNTVAKRYNASSRGRSKARLNLNGWEFCLVAGASLSQLKQQLERILQAEGSSKQVETESKEEGAMEAHISVKNDEPKDAPDSEVDDMHTRKKQKVEKMEGKQTNLSAAQSESLKDARSTNKSDEDDCTPPQSSQQGDLADKIEDEKCEKDASSFISDSDNEERILQKRTTRLSSGSIKNIDYSRISKQNNYDGNSSIDYDKNNEEKETEKTDTGETSVTGKRRRAFSRAKSSRIIGQSLRGSTKADQEFSSDGEEKTHSRASSRQLRGDKRKFKGSKVSEGEEEGNSSDGNEESTKQENYELSSQATGEVDAEDSELDQDTNVAFAEHISEIEKTELHLNWSKDERERLLEAIRRTSSQDPSTLAKHMEEKNAEDIKEYLSLITQRLQQVTGVTAEPDVSILTTCMALELFHSENGVAGIVSRKSEEMNRETGHEEDNEHGIHEKRSQRGKKLISDVDRKFKKMRKEIEELRNKIEMEMGARRELELEKQLLDVQLQEAKRATEREAGKRASVEDENDELKVRELETRRRLDRLKLKLTAMKLDSGTENPTAPLSPNSTFPPDDHRGDTGEISVEEKTESAVDHEVVDTTNTNVDSAGVNANDVEKLQEEISHLRAKIARLESEVSDFQQDAENERRKNHHLMEAKKYLEISLNEILHASKSASPSESDSTMKVNSTEQSSEHTSKAPFDSKNRNNNDAFISTVGRPSPFSSSVVARRRKSRAFRSL